MRRLTALGFLLVAALLALTAVAPAVSPAEERLRVEAGDLDDDRPLGEVAGYTAEEPLEIDADELSPADLEALKYRSMARIEEIRGLRFEEDVALEVVSRERYRAESSREGEAGPFVNEVWRGAFVVGETDIDDALAGVYGDAVVGYYSDGRIVLVVEEPDSLRLNRATLVHELVHALQDQRFGLGREGETIDERRAETGLIEGEAGYVPALYDDRCGEWECLPQDGEERAELRERPFDVGLFLSIYAPYAAGPSFVASLRETGGWEAVGRAFEERPASTEQLIHPERYPNDRPENVSIEDRSDDGWEPFTEEDGDGNASADLRTETVGEATLFATLFENGVVSRPIDEGAGDLGQYNYSHPATDGWAGDTFLAYRGPGNRTGHVWELAWESDRDAAEFADAYRDLLEERGAERIGASGETYRIPENRPFSGAYRLTVAGDRVTVVGGPTADALQGIRPTGAERAASLPGPTAPPGATELAPQAGPTAARAEPG
ncbi:Hvo_1808 family surface protein [Saliphagus infecundisoli]|uniref:Hvo_1808 family surface protein n=1 Tax=Saliphagus infecundisoli TaxID=1849069 RepID=A0ABD5QBG0_9EURY|nr:Hvo_1808 family surface protein [Saliphagus infecundisoli]